MLEKLKDKYRIVSKIGSGGMATIYKAIDLQSGHAVAIKLLHPDQRGSAVHKKRFLSEIELTKRVESPYVVKIVDAAYTDDLQYIAMELIEGSILKNYINSNGRLTVDETIAFAKQLALGFDEIHKAGITHRDIKSQNVMVAAHGKIKIIDFGIARTDQSEALTKEDSVIGSVQYMAPELIDQRTANVQSDIYALGILMYEMLSGDVPFRGSTSIDTLMMHKNLSVPMIYKEFPNVPIALSNIIAKATQKDLKHRYKTMYEVFKDLDVCQNSEHLLDKEYSPLQKSNVSFLSFVNSKKMLIALCIIVAFFLIGLTVMTIWLVV